MPCLTRTSGYITPQRPREWTATCYNDNHCAKNVGPHLAWHPFVLRMISGAPTVFVIFLNHRLAENSKTAILSSKNGMLTRELFPKSPHLLAKQLEIVLTSCISKSTPCEALNSPSQRGMSKLMQVNGFVP